MARVHHLVFDPEHLFVNTLTFCILLLLILQLLLCISYSIWAFSKLLMHRLCFHPSLIQRGGVRGVAYLEFNFQLVLHHHSEQKRKDQE